MAIKYIHFSYLRPSKIYPNLNFWFESKPSGNPDYLHDDKKIWTRHTTTKNAESSKHQEPEDDKVLTSKFMHALNAQSATSLNKEMK
jgi:hypothetical protein